MIRKQRPTFSSAELELQLQQVSGGDEDIETSSQSDNLGHNFIRSRESRSAGTANQVNTGLRFRAAVSEESGQIRRREGRGD